MHARASAPHSVSSPIASANALAPPVVVPVVLALPPVVTPGKQRSYIFFIVSVRKLKSGPGERPAMYVS